MRNEWERQNILEAYGWALDKELDKETVGSDLESYLITSR
jgi:hypothetical protein